MTRSVSHDRPEPVRRNSDSRGQKIQSKLQSDPDFLQRGLTEEGEDEKSSFQMDSVSKPAIPYWKNQHKPCCVLVLVYAGFSNRADMLMIKLKIKIKFE